MRLTHEYSSAEQWRKWGMAKLKVAVVQAGNASNLNAPLVWKSSTLRVFLNKLVRLHSQHSFIKNSVLTDGDVMMPADSHSCGWNVVIQCLFNDEWCWTPAAVSSKRTSQLTQACKPDRSLHLSHTLDTYTHTHTHTCYQDTSVWEVGLKSFAPLRYNCRKAVMKTESEISCSQFMFNMLNNLNLQML